VASVLGVQSVKVSVPTRQGTPATQMLSLMHNVLPFRRSDVGDLWARWKRYAQALSGLSAFLGKYLLTFSFSILRNTGFIESYMFSLGVRSKSGSG